MKKIDLSACSRHPLSYCDNNLLLIGYEGQLLRFISSEKADFYRTLLNSKVMANIMNNGLFVDSFVTDMVADNYPLIVQHEKISRVTFPNEWAPEALRKAGLALIELQIALLKDGYMVLDVYPWNILFRRGAPIFVDLGSIRKWDCNSLCHVLDELQRFYIRPLKLYEKGLWQYVVRLFSDHENGITYRDFNILGGVSIYERLTSSANDFKKNMLHKAGMAMPFQIKKHFTFLKRQIKKSIERTLTPNAAIELFACIGQTLEGIQPRHHSAWTSYYEEFSKHGQSLSVAEDWNIKQINVQKVLSELQPKSVMDMCSNRGWYSLLAESMGIEVVACDLVPDVVNQLFLKTNLNKLNICPIIMDFRYPTPARGVAYEWFPSAADRLQCEMVICLAALHHLVCKSWLSFEQVINGLHVFTTRWLLIEFIPPDDATAKQYLSYDQQTWYNETVFLNELNKKFKVIKRLDSYEKPRVLFLCERL